MKMNKIIWIKIENIEYYKLILKLSDLNVSIYEIKKFDNYNLVKIDLKDYKKIKKYLIYKTSIYSNTGILKLKELFKKYIIFIISVILGIILLFIANNMIFKIDIKTSNKEIKSLVLKELNKNGLKTLTLKKRHNKIENIVKKILDDNPNTLEWIEIEYDGLIMNVYVTEKTIKEEKEEYNNCNIIANKDAKILSLNVYNGEIIKDVNDYVNKGDIVLSGSIIHNEEVKNTVCASGEVYGEVWYKVKTTIPLIETSKKYTSKNRYNLSILIDDNNYKIFKSRLKIYDSKITNLYKLNNFEINLVKEKEYKNVSKKLTVEEAYNKGISLSLKKINDMLDKDEEILYKNVLKKETKNSTIYLEIFVVVKENIGEVQILKEETLSDNRSNSENSE